MHDNAAPAPTGSSTPPSEWAGPSLAAPDIILAPPPIAAPITAPQVGALPITAPQAAAPIAAPVTAPQVAAPIAAPPITAPQMPTPPTAQAAPSLPVLPGSPTAGAVAADPVVATPVVPTLPTLPAQQAAEPSAPPTPSPPDQNVPAFSASAGSATPPPTPPPPGADAVPPGYQAYDPAGAPKDLLPARFVRYSWLTLQAASVATILVEIAFLLTVALSVVALPIWSAVAGVNARRAKPDTSFEKAPRPSRLALSWFTPLAVAILWFGSIVFVNRSQSGSSGATASDSSMLLVVVGLLFLLASLFVPYAAHRRATRWVGGDGSMFTAWFWGPIAASFVGAIGQVALAAAIGALSDQTAMIVSVAIASLPGLVYIILGNRAMKEFETAAIMTSSRRVESSTVGTGPTAAQLAALQTTAAPSH